MTTRATATFTITAWDAIPYDEPRDGSQRSRVTVRKTFAGDIIGESTAELLMSQAADEVAGYVALEHVVASVHGRSGSFDVLHCATQGGPNARAIWLVSPGSGAGELRGLYGEVTYQHDEHGATFTLDYDFDASV